MSARRMKNPVAREHKPPPRSLRFASAPENMAETPSTTVQQWKQECLLQVEGALQLYANSLKLKAFFCLPLKEVYAVIRKALRSMQSNAPSSSLEPVTDDTTTDLDMEERVLYELLCACSPELYKLVSVQPQQLSPQFQYRGGHDDDKPVWCLQGVAVFGPRMPELRRLIAVRHRTPKSKSDELIQTLLANRSQDPIETKVEASTSSITQRHSPQKPKPSSAASMEPFLREGMTLDERVRARADAKLKREERADKASGKKAPLDREWLVRMANVLWYHSHDILQRQSRYQSPLRNNSNKRQSCSTTLKDVLQVLSRSLNTTSSVSSSRVPTHVHKAENKSRSKRQLLDDLFRLMGLVPEWIDMDVAGSDASAQPHTTVWFKAIDFAQVRARIMESQTFSDNDKKRPATAVDEQTTPPVNSLLRPAKHRRLLNTKNNKYTTPAAEGTLTSRSGTINLVTTSAPATGLVATKTRLSDAQNIHERDKDGGLTSVLGKRRVPLSHSSPTTSPHKKKKNKHALRINPGLVFSDADHGGIGEVIRPTPFDSPRGLKCLFTQMNAGKRI